MLRRGTSIAVCAALLCSSLTGAATSPSGCSGVRLLFKASPDAPTPGKTLKAAYTLSNKSGQNIQSSTVSIMLPGDVTYTSSISRPAGSAGTLAGGAVSWANGGAIRAGKSKTFMTQMTVGAGAQILAFDAMADVVLSDGTTCTVEAPESHIRAKGYKHAVAVAQQVGTYKMAARLDADAASSGYVEYVHLQAEGYEVVTACWTAAGDANKPAALTQAVGNPTSDMQQATFIRAIDGATPVVAPLEWYGRCDDSTHDQLPRDYSGSYLPFVDEYCVVDVEPGSTGVESTDYFDNEIYIANDYGGMFTIEGAYSNWALENARPNDQNVCYVFGTISYFPSQV